MNADIWGRHSLHRLPRLPVGAVGFLLICALGLVVGFGEVSTSGYRSWVQVFHEFTNGPDRVIFPVIVSLVAGVPLANELSNRFIVNTRTREDLRKHLGRLAFRGIAKAGFGFATLLMVYAVAAFAVSPNLFPGAVDPEAYGLEAASGAYAIDATDGAFANLANYGWPVLAIFSALWAGANAAIFAGVAVVSLLLIDKTIVALSIPFALYLFESVVTQILDLPGMSFLITAIHPVGLQEFDLAQVFAPTILLGLSTWVTLTVLIAQAPHNPRFS